MRYREIIAPQACAAIIAAQVPTSARKLYLAKTERELIKFFKYVGAYNHAGTCV